MLCEPMRTYFIDVSTPLHSAQRDDTKIELQFNFVR